MSLIQDALKRQQEESESSQVPLKVEPARPPAMLGITLRANNAEAAAPTLREVGAGGTAPSVPDAMPVPPSPPAKLGIALRASPEPAAPVMTSSPVSPVSPEKPGKSWKLIAGIIIFCILIVWGGGLLVVLVLKQSPDRTLLGSFMPGLTKVHVTLGKSSPPPAAQPSAMVMSKPVVAPSPAQASASRPWISPAAAAASAFADEGEDAIEKDMALSGVKDQVNPAARPRRKIAAILSNAGADQEGVRLKPEVWPRLKLSAIFSNVGSGQSGARLNNRLILLGDKIDGVTLVEINRDRVVLKCGRETRSLKMGMTLY